MSDLPRQHPVQQGVCLAFLCLELPSSLGDDLLQIVGVFLELLHHVVDDVV